MNFDGFVLAAVAAELDARCRGAFVNRVYQPADSEIELVFTGRGPRQVWFISVAAADARCHLLPRRSDTRGAPAGFCAALRREIVGARLVEVRQPGFDRVLRLTFQRAQVARTLVHEIMGRHSNLVLLNDEGGILAAAKHVAAARSRAREILPGRPYEPPPTPRANPHGLDEEGLRALVDEEPLTAASLSRTVSGIGPFAAREILLRAGESTAGRVAAALAEVVAAAAEGRFSPVAWSDPLGHPADFWAFPPVQALPTAAVGCESMSAAVARTAEWQAGAGRAEASRRRWAAAMRRERDWLDAQVERAREAITHESAAENFRIQGELLLGQGSRISRGSTSVELANYYDPEQRPIRVELDPELTARENAERYFRRSRRAVSAAAAARERLPDLEGRVEAMVRFEARLASTLDADLPGLEQELERSELLRPPPAPATSVPAARSPYPAGIRIRRYALDGWEVLWGENAASNDYLTTRLAQPGDTWLHARAVTGAHVVVRGGGRGTAPPRRVLEAAARTAAAHSDAKHSSVVAVDHTERRHVRKPRGSAPGVVTYANEKTLHVSPQTAGDE